MRRAPFLLCCCITMVSARYYRNIKPYYYKQLAKDGSIQEATIRLPHAGISSIFGNIHNPPLSKSTAGRGRHPFLRHNLSLLYLASPSMINPTAINPVMPIMPVHQSLTAVRRPMAAVRRPMGAVRRQMGAVQRPMAAGRRPMGAVQRPMRTVQRPMAARFQSFRARKNISVEPTITVVTKKDTAPLPVIGFQSNMWVWPKGDVTGPLLGVPVKSVQQLPDKTFL